MKGTQRGHCILSCALQQGFPILMYRFYSILSYEVGTAFTMQRKDLTIEAFNGILYPCFAAGCGMIWATARIIYGALTASPACVELFWLHRAFTTVQNRCVVCVVNLFLSLKKDESLVHSVYSIDGDWHRTATQFHELTSHYKQEDIKSMHGSTGIHQSPGFKVTLE